MIHSSAFRLPVKLAMHVFVPLTVHKRLLWQVSARGMVQGFSEEERLGKITSGKTPRSR